MQSRYLALVQCPLFVPITLGPGEARDFVSVYMVVRDVPRTVRSFAVTYEIPGRERTGS